jgi:SAM-dependent methyltransferase
MAAITDAFTQFEHEGWQRVANKYDSVWASLTRQFVPHLVHDAATAAGISILDVACGPGYLSDYARKLGAIPIGIDFSEQMVTIAQQMFPGISFICGDAQHLPFDAGSFDRVLINFGLLHVAKPEQACAEAARVLKRGGKFGFTVWAGPEQNPGAKIVNDAIEAHGDLNVDLPAGPPHYLYGDKEECRKVWRLSVLLENRSFFGRARSNGVCRVGHFFSRRNSMPAFKHGATITRATHTYPARDRGRREGVRARGSLRRSIRGACGCADETLMEGRFQLLSAEKYPARRTG